MLRFALTVRRFRPLVLIAGGVELQEFVGVVFVNEVHVKIGGWRVRHSGGVGKPFQAR